MINFVIDTRLSVPIIGKTNHPFHPDMKKIFFYIRALTLVWGQSLLSVVGGMASLSSLLFGAAALLAPGGTAEAGDALAANLFRRVVAEQKEGNVVFSPASAEAVLLMLREGAAGQTKAELAALPYGKQGVPSAMRVESANALFVDDSLKLKRVSVPVHRVPFTIAPDEAANSVNAWCCDKTHGKIPSVFDAVPPLTRLMAVNAVYLKERWLRPFEPDDTKEEDFHLRDGRTVKVPMMFKETDLLYAEGEDWQAVALFYRTDGRKGEPGCFIGILPRGDAREFAATLTPQKFNAIRTALAKSGYNETQVRLPRFKVNTDAFSLVPALQAVGVRQAFDERKADFSALVETAPGENLYLRSVVQKCYVDVSEQGTEAAAVTAASPCCEYISLPRIIRFDRPVLWVIGDITTDAPPYFMGLVEEVRS